MALITLDEIDTAARQKYAGQRLSKSAAAILNEEVDAVSLETEFDIFLSHSYQDARLNLDRLLGVKAFLERFRCSVYVDWIIDRELDRSRVTETTASTLRIRMNHCRCLLFATSENSQHSRWMPWELGYMDGRTADSDGFSKVAILPLAGTAGQMNFDGQEYLGIYPYVDEAKANTNDGNNYLWVNWDSTTNKRFGEWLQDQRPES